MGRLARGSILGKPSNENYGTNLSDEEGQAAKIELDTRTALEDLDAAEAQLVDNDEEGTTLSEALSDTYPEVVEILEEAQEKGGISVESARLLNVINRLHGIDETLSVSVEAFGDTGRSMAATRVAVEGIKATLKDWWRKLKAWFMKMRAKLKTWWEKNWAAAPRLKAQAEAIRQRANAGSSAPKETSFELVRAAQTLFVNNAFPSDLAGELKKVNHIADTVFNKTQKQLLTTATTILGVVETATFTSEADVAKITGELNGAVNAMTEIGGDIFGAVSGSDVPDIAKVQDGYYAVRTTELPGGKAVYAIGRKKSTTADIRAITDAITSQRVVVGPFRAKEAGDEAKKVPTAGRTVIQGICDEVVVIASTIEAYKRNFAAQETARKELDKAGDSLDRATNGASEQVEGVNSVIGDLKRIITASANMIEEPSRSFGSEFIKIGRNALQYAERSMSQYA